ncbi:shikimate kinase [Dyadobacter tibetensis]|uniref:shikimate kinase n=1 Tax=Dyadobacter tibetensis TaxID=1211851 RepID=UPI00046EAC20|nr:shikimate kinase [Dyadobacter tibetensis]
MKNIILVGMMSSGKTTIGKKLAQKLGYNFVDLDQLIVEDQGMEITEIFSQHGEAYFRKVETELLNKLRPDQKLVIASGGGTPCFNNNMETINNLGISVYLDLPASVLAQRIRRHNKDDRPILSGAESLEDVLNKKISERSPDYNLAHYKISAEYSTSELVEIISGYIVEEGV